MTRKRLINERVTHLTGFLLGNLKQCLLLTGVMIVLCGIVYPLVLWGVGLLVPEKALGSPVYVNGQVVGFRNIGQYVKEDRYFQGRPSAVEYNAASAGGSNFGPSNPEYLQLVKARVDTFLVHNPTIQRQQIPAELVTASGSGLDPHLSPPAVYVQIGRVARARKMDEKLVRRLVEERIEKPLLGIFGQQRVNVLELNVALDQLNAKTTKAH